MNDQEKSVLIAQAMGLRVQDVLVNPIQSGFGGKEPIYCPVIYYTDPAGYARETTDMYAGSQGAEIAWMALNWVTDTERLHNE